MLLYIELLVSTFNCGFSKNSTKYFHTIDPRKKIQELKNYARRWYMYLFFQKTFVFLNLAHFVHSWFEVARFIHKDLTVKIESQITYQRIELI